MNHKRIRLCSLLIMLSFTPLSALSASAAQKPSIQVNKVDSKLKFQPGNTERERKEREERERKEREEKEKAKPEKKRGKNPSKCRP